jgi:hypothetical protein
MDHFRCGYYETKSKVIANPGWHTSFCAMSTSPLRLTELDGFEINTKSPTSISSGIVTFNFTGEDRKHAMQQWLCLD